VKKDKKSKNKQKNLTGPISINTKGVGFFDLPAQAGLPDKDNSIEIQPENINRAFQGDIVEVRVTSKKIRGREQGEVVKIITRAKNRYVGIIQKTNDIFYLVPDDKKMYLDIRITDKNISKDLENKKVLVEITDWKETEMNPSGKIVKVVGTIGENNTEMESIVLEKGFNVEFPASVESEAENLKKEVPVHFAEELKKRRDMRGTTTMTIDPVDAKDFDDAISFKDLDGGEYEIGIHIADVSHFVRPNTELDKEAEKRGLSVYLVDRTIPMLPEVLSNDLCSLNPNEDKYTFSAVFKITSEGKVLDKWFGKTVIHSDKRFSYEEAQETIDFKDGALPPARAGGAQAGLLQKELLTLRAIAKKLEKQKFSNGAINFETEEVKFELDKTGKPIRVYKKSRLDTHKLVEEYMLLANREVAKFIFHSQNENSKNKVGMKQSVYRIHGKPDKERIESLAVFLKALGFDLRNKNGEVTSHDINKLLKEVEGTPNEELIKTATIRSMQKAVYSTKNIGHFGLAFRFYTHFTSPIRRYPDLLVHRFLERELKGGKIEQNEYEKFEKICLASSDLEKKASDAERASIKYKQVEYMQGHVGEIFDGVITGVTEWGIYVEEKETKCEGMIKLRDLSDDYYILDEKNYTVKGQKKGKKFTLGDTVRFKVVSADLEKRVLDYTLV
jgi:ribonuclease R